MSVAQAGRQVDLGARVQPGDGATLLGRLRELGESLRVDSGNDRLALQIDAGDLRAILITEIYDRRRLDPGRRESFPSMRVSRFSVVCSTRVETTGSPSSGSPSASTPPCSISSSE